MYSLVLRQQHIWNSGLSSLGSKPTPMHLGVRPVEHSQTYCKVNRIVVLSLSASALSCFQCERIICNVYLLLFFFFFTPIRISFFFFVFKAKNHQQSSQILMGQGTRGFPAYNRVKTLNHQQNCTHSEYKKEDLFTILSLIHIWRCRRRLRCRSRWSPYH